MATLQLSLIEFQCFLLGSLGGVGHIALMRLLHTIDSARRATSDKHLTEETASFLVLQSVDRENLLAIDIGQS